MPLLQHIPLSRFCVLPVQRDMAARVDHATPILRDEAPPLYQSTSPALHAADLDAGTVAGLQARLPNILQPLSTLPNPLI